jgi:hypothetical protein
MTQIERPAPVLVSASNHDLDGFTDAAIGPGARIPQIIESAQDVVIPECGKRKPEPAFVDHFAGSKRAEHAALDQIFFGFSACPGDRRRFASGSLVFEQPFEHTDGGVKG